MFKDSLNSNFGHVFNIFQEILKLFRFIFVLRIFAGWLKIGAITHLENILKIDFYYNLKSDKLCRPVILTHYAMKIVALVSPPIQDQKKLFHVKMQVQSQNKNVNNPFSEKKGSFVGLNFIYTINAQDALVVRFAFHMQL